jgi:hypothetical protein
MGRLWSVVCLAMMMSLAAPVVVPVEWTSAEAKRVRVKQSKPLKSSKSSRSEKSRRPERSEPRTAQKPSVATSEVASSPASSPIAWPLTLTLSTDQTSYRAGDLITIAVVADAACDLTLISIDGDGFASVLFPNEYEPNNLLNAEEPITIPGKNSAYQLRVKAPGTETLLGICAPPGTRPRGVVADYERYRFTLLGDWAAFTSSIDQREAEIVKNAAEAARKRKRKAPPLAPLLPPSDPGSQGRSLLLINVDEAH